MWGQILSPRTLVLCLLVALALTGCVAASLAMPGEVDQPSANGMQPEGLVTALAAPLHTPTTQPSDLAGQASETATLGPASPLRLPTPTAQAPILSLPSPTPAPSLAALVVEPTPDGVTRTSRIPILMYHYLSIPPADADIYRQDLSVSPDLFAAHLDRLSEEGYTTISLYDLMRHLNAGTALPEKPVIITFDDGYRDNYENAFPLLKARKMTATFFVVTDFIDEERPAYLSWDMVREMLAGGMSIESHGRNHVSLADKDTDYLVWQALGSMETIEFELGQRPRFVSYPAGEYDQRTIAVFESANYWAGLTTEQGMEQHSDDPFRLERIRVRNVTTPDKLIQLLSLDW